MRGFHRNPRDHRQNEEQHNQCIRSRAAIADDRNSSRPHSSDKQRSELEGRGYPSQDRDQCTFEQHAAEKPIMILSQAGLWIQARAAG